MRDCRTLSDLIISTAPIEANPGEASAAMALRTNH
jgi:hypothetical protein